METDIIRSVLYSVFFCLSCIGILLLIGAFLRARINIMQRLFLPASVIGGLIGLILRITLFNENALFPLPKDWDVIFSLLPAILIVPIVASIPLGLNYINSNDKKIHFKKGSIQSITIMFIILGIIGASQSLLGLSIASFFKNALHNHDIYATFGTELSAGFAGGHGTAGIVSNILQSFDQSYWNTAQGITITVATVGIVSGILIGIIFINISARLGYTTFIQTKNEIALDIKTGVQPNVERQPISGKETTNPASIDSLSFHFALIFMVSGLAFLVVHLFRSADILILSFIPVWSYAMIIMFLLWGFMQKVGLNWSIDVKTKSKITAVLTEFTIVAAIVSLPLDIVLLYVFPLSLMLISGLCLTILLTCFLSKAFFSELWFERSMTIFGTSTGVFITGILLLKMVDPEMKSPILIDYSFAYSINSIISFILFPISFGLLINYGFNIGILFYICILLLYIILLFFVKDRKQSIE